MRDRHEEMFALLIIAAIVVWPPTPRTQVIASQTPLRLVRTIPLPDVQGRIDHMAVDVKGNRLFVAALGNNSLEVIDLNAGKHSRSVKGFHEPQGVAYLPNLNRLAVANGQGGGLVILDGASFREIHRVASLEDADNVRAVGGEFVVGYGRGAMTRINGKTGVNYAEPYSTLSGHPESFQLSKNNCWFINVPTAGQVAVMDSEKMAPIGKWEVKAARDNYPMAVDNSASRVFIGCRKPPKVLIYQWRNLISDTGWHVTGDLKNSLEIHGDTDDLFWDAARRRLYVSCGEGYIDIYQEGKSGEWLRQSIATVPGARTSLWIPELNQLVLACRRNRSQPAEIRVYEAQ